LSQASTCFFAIGVRKGADGRDKPGHDDRYFSIDYAAGKLAFMTAILTNLFAGVAGPS
jgi:hypothetical protein